MRYYLGVAKDKGVSEGAIRETMAVVVAVSGGRVRAQAREAMKGVLDPLPQKSEKASGSPGCGCR